MCGQVGLILGLADGLGVAPPWFSHLDELKNIFKALLVANQVRGPHAVGIGYMDEKGRTNILKASKLSSEFVETSDYQQFVASINHACAVLVGHTRWPSKKHAPIYECDNQPLRVGSMWGTHNGTIYNADELFDLWRLPRSATVDSEIIFQLANRHLVDGVLDVSHFLEDIRLMRGQYSGVLLNEDEPSLAWLVLGSKPLSIWVQKDWNVVMFNSLVAHVQALDIAQSGWTVVDVPVMSYLRFDRRDLLSFTQRPFDMEQETHSYDPP